MPPVTIELMTWEGPAAIHSHTPKSSEPPMTAEAALFSVILVKIELRIDIVACIAFLPFKSRNIGFIVNLSSAKQNRTCSVGHFALQELAGHLALPVTNTAVQVSRRRRVIAKDPN
jgi:hypothetical protein